jgi:flagellum-specific ATP synthase
VAGSDPETDRAIVLYPALQRFLMQDMHEAATLPESLRQMQTALQDDKEKGAPQRQTRPHHNPYEGSPG